MNPKKKKMVENESKSLGVSYGESVIGELASMVRWRRREEGKWEWLRGGGGEAVSVVVWVGESDDLRSLKGWWWGYMAESD